MTVLTSITGPVTAVGPDVTRIDLRGVIGPAVLDCRAATAVQSVQLLGCQGITVQDLTLHREWQDGDSWRDDVVAVHDSRDVWLRDARLSGSLHSGEVNDGKQVTDAPFGTGVVFRNCGGGGITGCLIDCFRWNASLSRCSDFLFAGNTLPRSGDDPLRLRWLRGVVIECNIIPPGLRDLSDTNHPDWLQNLYHGSDADAPGADIVIRRNIGWSRNRTTELRGPLRMQSNHRNNGLLFHRVVIEDNVILVDAPAGIVMAAGAGTVVRRNIVLPFYPPPGDSWATRKDYVPSITLRAPQEAPIYAGNATMEEHHHGDVLPASNIYVPSHEAAFDMPDRDDPMTWKIKPDGPLAGFWWPGSEPVLPPVEPEPEPPVEPEPEPEPEPPVEPPAPEPDALLLEVRALREQVRDLLVVQRSALSLMGQWARHQGMRDE